MKLIKISREVEVTVGNWNTNGKTKVYLTPAKRANGISEVDKSLFGLWNEYNILMAKSTCVTLTFPSTINGKPHCMIWGIRSGEKIEENDCYNSSYSTCGELSIAIENPTTDPCYSYDVSEEIATKLAYKKEGIVI
ncbi:uncharacterized protein LOC119179807 isoform X1 [Rhipicephalus microplus]|uniref:uncharacterized protein LOC119179807 isoform X1 n=1 Tax=Rhipicephalus microplus TaxID=6941 RepID=UPI003F6D25B8